jgi:flagellar assembly protein FliH
MVSDQKDKSINEPIRDTISFPAGDPLVSSWEFPLIENDELESGKGDFKDKLARMEREAYEKGFEQGRKDGLDLEQKKIEEMGKELESLFSGLRDLKEKIYRESEGDLLKLSTLIAKKIIREEVKIHEDIIINMIQSTLKFLTDKRKLKIIIHPDDMEEVKRLLPDIAKVTNGGQFQLTEDHTIERGGCILETGYGKINATIEDQLGMIEEEIDKEYNSCRGEFHESIA